MNLSVPTGDPRHLLDTFHDAVERALPQLHPDSRAGWVRHYAEHERDIEQALGGICWDYRDRPVVCATVLLLDRLAGVDPFGPKAYRKTIADGYRALADQLDPPTA